MPKNKKVYVVMGVSGSGKSLVGRLLAEALALPFFDGDDYHPAENIAKMASGKALDDRDRKGWLIELNQIARDQVEKGAVIACSALKKKHRALLRAGLGDKMARSSALCFFFRAEQAITAPFSTWSL